MERGMQMRNQGIELKNQPAVKTPSAELGKRVMNGKDGKWSQCAPMISVEFLSDVLKAEGVEGVHDWFVGADKLEASIGQKALRFKLGVDKKTMMPKGC